jgi:predicted signal transduction protein with EAL and GGDEF domain
VSGERRPGLWRLVVWSVIGLGAAIVAFYLPAAIRFATSQFRPGFWGLTVGALVVDIPLFGQSRRQDRRTRSTMSVCFTFAIFVLWGAGPAVVVQAAAGAVTVIGQRYTRTEGLYLIARLVCATAVAQIVVDTVYGHRITAPGQGLTGHDLIGFLLLSTVWLSVSYGLLAIARTTVGAQRLRQAAADIRLDLLTTAAAVLIVSPLLTTIHGFWKVVVALPLILLNQIVREQLRREQGLSREPVSGALNRQGLVGGMKAITDYDYVGQGGPRPFGIVLIDFESVLTINRRLGRDIYEDLVKAATQRLVQVYGEDQVARLSGEATVILVPDLTEADAVGQAEAAVEVLAEPLDVDGVPFSLDPVAGVVLSPEHGGDLGTLLAKAELAVTEARRHTRRATLYMREATETAQRRLMLVRELRAVLSEPSRWGELSMLYQPQVELDTGRLTGVEALVRWRHPEWGPVPTDELIEAVEPTDLMHMLTRHVLRSVVTQMRQWNDEGQPLRVAINISVQDMHDPAFVSELGTLIAEHGIATDQVTIEITERMLITDEPRVGQVAEMLTRLGVGLSLDDFGTGHASLQQLRQLPLTEVKVDRLYVSGIVDNPGDRAVVTSVHQMARALGVTVVAEGVEDARTADALAQLPGTIGQGWHFGAPMPADEVRRHARQGSTWSRQV